jgi:hypothetical protein
LATSLTWEGHKFLANARDDTRWQQAKEVVKQKGGDVSPGVLTQLLTSLAKSALRGKRRLLAHHYHWESVPTDSRPSACFPWLS